MSEKNRDDDLADLSPAFQNLISGLRDQNERMEKVREDIAEVRDNVKKINDPKEQYRNRLERESKRRIDALKSALQSGNLDRIDHNEYAQFLTEQKEVVSTPDYVEYFKEHADTLRLIKELADLSLQATLKKREIAESERKGEIYGGRWSKLPSSVRSMNQGMEKVFRDNEKFNMPLKQIEQYLANIEGFLGEDDFVELLRSDIAFKEDLLKNLSLFAKLLREQCPDAEHCAEKADGFHDRVSQIKSIIN